MARRILFEHVREPLLPHHLFLQRMLICAFWAGFFLMAAISLGALGYSIFEGQGWVDSFLNAVMLMTGLGLEGHLHTVNGKLFTIIYSLLSPLVFYSTLVIFFTPILHRLLHHFHLDLESNKE